MGEINLIKVKNEKEVALNNFIIAKAKAHNRLIKLIKAEEKYEEEMNALIQALNNDFDVNESHIIIEKYVNGKSFEEIADDLHFTSQYVRVTHMKAMRKFNNLPDKNCKKQQENNTK